jgi:hypothetical protein
VSGLTLEDKLRVVVYEVNLYSAANFNLNRVHDYNELPNDSVAAIEVRDWLNSLDRNMKYYDELLNFVKRVYEYYRENMGVNTRHIFDKYIEQIKSKIS